MRRLGAVFMLWMLGFGMPHEARAASSDDVRVMALNMYHEARGEGRLGMIAVGWVVLNRMADKAYPDSVAGVVYQGCQFSWVCDGRSDRPRDARAWGRALQLATELLDRPSVDPTRGAMWYHATWVRNPRFGPRVARIAHIGRHVFYARVEQVRPAVAGPRLLFASR
jgi:spore germination cell wall hydrolase CwlJ-like protein